MEEHRKCGFCDAYLPLSALAHHSCEGVQEAKREEERKAAIKQEYGQRAQHVDYYKPNRKQKRAQEAVRRKQAAKNRRK